MNDENKIPLPELPSEDDVRRAKMEELRPYWLDPRIDYPEPYFMLEYNGVPFSTIGGIQAISGQKKNGKTFVLTMLMAAVLGHDTERVQEFLPGLTVPERTIDYLGHEPRVLFVDTEMEKLSSAKVLRRVHWLCGWDMKTPNDRFNVLWLRSVKKDEKEEAYQKRFRLIHQAIDAVEPDFVIIDGLRDVMATINDEAQATAVIGDLSALAEERQMCIWNALHQNPRPGNDMESKMRGWTGTELGNKVSDTFLSIKQKKGADVIFTVKQDDARNKDVEDFQYIITDDAGSLGIPKILNTSASSTPSIRIEGDAMEDVERWFHEAKDKVEWPATRRTIKEVIIRDHGKQTNKTKQDIDLQMLINKRLLVNSSVKQKGYWLLVPNDEDERDPLPEPTNEPAPF
jgi:hypothetical protein